MDCPESIALAKIMLPILIPMLSVMLFGVSMLITWIIWDEIRKAIKQRSQAKQYSLLVEAESIASYAWYNPNQTNVPMVATSLSGSVNSAVDITHNLAVKTADTITAACSIS